MGMHINRKRQGTPPTLKKHAKVDEQTIQGLCTRIVQDFQPEQIILFGSYAYGNPTLI